MLETNNDTIEQREMFAPPADSNNVFSFSTTLKELRKNLEPEQLHRREGIRDRKGNNLTFEYVEWHTVADILDETAPNWNHSIKDIRTIGDITIVTVAIAIDGVTREGIGTGSARSETGIKKAEHDALKRAAVKFGIARELYKRDGEFAERAEAEVAKGFAEPEVKPDNAIALSIGEMITTKQMGMIRAVARERNINADTECRSVMKCRINELSRTAASTLIHHLQNVAVDVPMKQAS